MTRHKAYKQIVELFGVTDPDRKIMAMDILTELEAHARGEAIMQKERLFRPRWDHDKMDVEYDEVKKEADDKNKAWYYAYYDENGKECWVICDSLQGAINESRRLPDGCKFSHIHFLWRQDSENEGRYVYPNENDISTRYWQGSNKRDEDKTWFYAYYDEDGNTQEVYCGSIQETITKVTATDEKVPHIGFVKKKPFDNYVYEYSVNNKVLPCPEPVAIYKFGKEKDFSTLYKVPINKEPDITYGDIGYETGRQK